MTAEDHLSIALQGAHAIAAWREGNPGGSLNLAGVRLRRADLVRADLTGANLQGANLEWADLRWADLAGADFSGANLSKADFHKADLANAHFARANLIDCNLEDANCRGADFEGAIFAHTRILNADLAGTKGLDSTQHFGPSMIDSETLLKSGHLPSEFLRNCGLSETAIKATHRGDRSRLDDSLQRKGGYHSCFISYASEDVIFAEKLLHDLQDRGIRCWYAPKDMRIGGRILDTIFNEIRQRERLVLILSEHSVDSDWVRDEVERAFAEERDRGDTVVFPIRLDDAVMVTHRAWAEKIREQRHIGDFRSWKEAGSYSIALSKVIDDLRTRQEP